MREPLAAWGDDESRHPDLVWWSRLDNKYQIEVQAEPEDEYSGILCIFDVDRNNKLLFEREVGISFGAKFGIDAGDALEWQQIVIDYIDSLGE